MYAWKGRRDVSCYFYLFIFFPRPSIGNDITATILPYTKYIWLIRVCSGRGTIFAALEIKP